MEPSDILSVASRRRIFECVKEHPGAHLRETARRCELPLGTTLYHLDYLEANGLIVARRDGRYKRFFASHSMGRREKELVSILRHNAPRRIMYVLLQRGPSTQREMCKAIGVSRSTLSFHVNRLVVEGAVLRQDGRPEHLYSVAEPELARDLLSRFEASLSREDAARFGPRAVPVEAPAEPDPALASG